ncbi:hypothetical protein [Actinospica sp.]|uniref:hypothetical protein n=1 Tax=Actinospica sp. TaxID=1872142 RepID=UPI002CBD49D4|nr:hypothetical protein [Actinospica sp.]HWG22578.1 hypothetical protein [Actinospica sp.]
MAVDGDLKSRLPYPFNEDLSPVLIRLNRRTERGRLQLANDPVTAAYLAAALRLVERRLGPRSEEEAGERDPAAAERSFFGFLTQRAVAAEVAGNPDPLPRRGSVSTLRTSWRTQADFIADLLGFVLWTGYYPASYTSLWDGAAEQLAEADDFAEAVQEVAYNATAHLLAMVTFRIQLAASIGAQDDPAVRGVLAAKYERGQAIWGGIYTRMMTARGLQLREGISLGQLADILTALVEGCALRAMAEGPETRVLNVADKRGLLSTAALALLAGSMEPKGLEDGLSLAESINAMAAAGRKGSG